MAAKKPARDMVTVVEELIAASVASSDPEMQSVERRPPATSAQIAALEKAWKRPLPPSYRAFLEVTNGLAGDCFTHRLLGTEDLAWAEKQVDQMAEFWDEDEFDQSKMFFVAVPDGDSGISNLAAFARGKGAELPVVDWDIGSELQRFSSFRAYLEDAIALQRSLLEGKKARKKAAAAAAKKEAGGREALAKAKALPRSGRERAAAFDATFKLEDLGEIDRAVRLLVDARPTSKELREFCYRLGRDTESKTAAAFARAELIFASDLVVPDDARESHVRELNDALARYSQAKVRDPGRAERWADAARPFVLENSYLGHNLAWAYVAAGRLDDAYEMAKAGIAAGYPCTAQMRTDPDLGPLLEEPRFQALFGSGDTTTMEARTSIPRNPKLEAAFARGEAIAEYGAWLKEQGSPLGAIIEADLAGEKVPQKRKGAKTKFAAYVKTVLAPAFPLIAKHFTHFFDSKTYFSFRYGFLEKLDTFDLTTDEERREVIAFLNDPHGRFVKHIALRKAKLDDFELYARLPALRQIQNRWTDITQVDSLAPLAGLTELRALHLENSKVKDLTPLAKLPILQLYLEKTAVTDLSPLAGHPTLSDVDLNDTSVSDLSPLLGCPKICGVNLYGVKTIDQAQVDELTAYVKRANNAPVNDPALINGYRQTVFWGGTGTDVEDE